MNITINILELLVWLFGAVFIWKNVIPDDWTDELGAIGGYAVEAAYTIIYFVIFYFYLDIQMQITATP